MATRVKISDFLNFHFPGAVLTSGKASNPPKAGQDGYVMGGDGRVATDEYVKSRAKSSYPTTWAIYYAAYKKWIGRRVYDCNALAEAFYKLRTGVDINTKARLNYAGWCSARSTSKADSKLTGMPQKPGVALFSGSSASTITHVGFLLWKFGTGDLDWYVLECRGKDYGKVITTLQSRSWRWWGVMDRYYDYDVTASWIPTGEGEEMLLTYCFQKAAFAAGYDTLKSGATWKDIVTGENNGCDNNKGSWTVDLMHVVQAKHGLPKSDAIDEKLMAAVMSEVGTDAALQVEYAAYKERVSAYVAGVQTAAAMKI